MSQRPVTASHVPAGLDRRFFAFLVDHSVAWASYAAVAYLASRWWLGHGHPLLGAVVIGATVLAVSLGFALLAGLLGTSPGKSLLGLRVVDAETGEPIGVAPALARSVILGLATLPTFGLGVAILAWTALMDPQHRRRGWHDLRTGSVVLDVRTAPVVAAPAPEAPRAIVNLTAMRLMPGPDTPTPAPVLGLAAPPRPVPRAAAGPSAPPPAPAPSAAPSPAPSAAPAAKTPVPTAQPLAPVPTAPSPAPGPFPASAWAPASVAASEPAAEGAGEAVAEPEAWEAARPPAGVPASDRTTARPARASRAPAQGVRWRVNFDSGESLVVEGLVLIGRKPEPRPGESVQALVPLVSRDMSVSKTHAQLHLADGALVVMDRGSTNGSVLVREGLARELRGNRPATLLAGDRVRFGDRQLVVVAESAAS